MKDRKLAKLIKNIGIEYKDGSSVRRGSCYQPTPFNVNIPCNKNRPIRKEYKIISSDIGDKPKNIFEIGCANGFYSVQLAKKGHQVTAIDGDCDVIALNNYLKEKEGIENVSFSCCYLSLDNLKFFEHHYDVIIMMNVHMWMHKQLGSEITRKLMSKLSSMCDTMYFQTSHKESTGMYRVKELENREDLQDYLESFDFNKVEILNLNNTKLHRGIRYLFKCQKQIQ